MRREYNIHIVYNKFLDVLFYYSLVIRYRRNVYRTSSSLVIASAVSNSNTIKHFVFRVSTIGLEQTIY